MLNVEIVIITLAVSVLYLVEQDMPIIVVNTVKLVDYTQTLPRHTEIVFDREQKGENDEQKF